MEAAAKTDKWSFKKAINGEGVCCDCGRATSSYSLTRKRWACSPCALPRADLNGGG